MANNYDKRNYCYTYLLTNPRPKNKKNKKPTNANIYYLLYQQIQM